MDRVNSEVLVAISAALSSYNTRPGFNIVVKSLKRVNGNSTVWSTAGRIERLGRMLNS